ncbi:hypothetical protein [Streptomyces marincola]|uniref:hypothetical protein n=1 Tax=Streptomyces marincola TaxID=2878388 RepID=UPI001CF0FA9D|nr:hypothetical protein [Streptomyces marincola]UCM86646.1 hypothetical protein LC193_01070 [Streptomyces marincola]
MPGSDARSQRGRAGGALRRIALRLRTPRFLAARRRRAADARSAAGTAFARQAHQPSPAADHYAAQAQASQAYHRWPQ